jgi:hypothetical protein
MLLIFVHVIYLRWKVRSFPYLISLIINVVFHMCISKCKDNGPIQCIIICSGIILVFEKKT